MAACSPWSEASASVFSPAGGRVAILLAAGQMRIAGSGGSMLPLAVEGTPGRSMLPLAVEGTPPLLLSDDANAGSCSQSLSSLPSDELLIQGWVTAPVP